MDRIGVIIPWHRRDKVNPVTIINLIERNQHYFFCFVLIHQNINNLEYLQEIKKAKPENVNIVKPFRVKGEATAISEGVKYLGHREEISQICLLDEDLSSLSLRRLEKLLSTREKLENLSLTCCRVVKQKLKRWFGLTA